jgi:hypothetical protein
MPGGDLFPRLISFLSSTLQALPDPRTGTNTRYSVLDFAMSAFATFHCQSPSFLAHQHLMQQARGVNNAATVFGIEELPSDNQIRNVLDLVDPQLLLPVYQRSFAYLQDQGVVESFRSFANTLLIPLDGTGYFSSESIHCESCSVAHHRDGRLSYSHSVLMAALVAPGRSEVIPLEPEFISPQQDKKAQDCELEAAKRWITTFGPRYSPLAVTLLADALYGCKPIIELILQQELHYLIVAKPKSNKYLYQELQSLEKLGELHQLTRTRWTGKQRQQLNYRYVNDVNLSDGPDSLQTNWAQLTITNQKGHQTFQVAFITSHLIDEHNVEALVEAGRCRWKIENENFNTLKTKGYHFEHNFGHGKKFLSQILLSLNILAFLFHTVLQLCDQTCREVRSILPRRETFYQHLATLTQYWCFASWQSLVAFMLRALKEGPRPPPEPFSVIQ